MHRVLGSIVLLLASTAGGALAAQGLGPDESSRLQAALDAQGCSGGSVHISNDQFVVSRARCGDEKHYDFAFDRDFKLLSKNLRN